jgi:predicted amidohydrolase YtcJ
LRGDYALVNGRVHTPLGVVDALRVKAGRIAAVGSNLDTSGAREVFDLMGRTVFPGFTDSHMHLMSWLESLEILDLTPCRSISGLRAALREYAEANPDKDFYRARGWNETSWPEHRRPTRHDLDDIFPDKPVVLIRVCGHVAVLNGAAMRFFGLGEAEPVEGGLAERDEHGEPTGVFAERALSLIYGRLPRPSLDEMREMLKKYGPLAASFGLTHVNSEDMGPFRADFRKLLGFFADAARDGTLPFRVRHQLNMPRQDVLLDFLSDGLRSGDGGPMSQVGPLKLVCDGSLGGHTASLLEPYSDSPDGDRGIASFEQEELNQLVRMAHTSGMQVATHAIGDGALEMCLNAIEAAQGVGRPMQMRHQIVHAQIANDAQLDRMKRLRVGAMVQPMFVPSDRDMAVERLGKERAERSYRWKTMIKKGILTSGGSDAPIESPRPLWGIHAAVNRQAPGDDRREPWMPAERLTIGEAIAMYTWADAWQSGNEQRRGEIAEGRDADLVILDDDPFLVPRSDIWAIGVAMTICGGRVTHASSSLSGGV